ncbi:MAG TPA: hypothetical protein VL485_33285 [Ktedonobacteraceae bacterium]|jgi:hypothetical protein|nr:hypothetical protein [Ktedonobacteraceae bacterium]
MSTNAGQIGPHEHIDPMIEVLIEGLRETILHPRGASNAISAALIEELIESLSPSARTASSISPFELAILAESLAPALAKALAPALAEALAPALIRALDTIAAGREEHSKRSLDA